MVFIDFLQQCRESIASAPFRDKVARMRALGLDVGMRTIGVALSDELGMLGHPLATLARQGTSADVDSIVALCQEHHVTDVVVGIPYELSGREGHRAKRVRVLLDAVQERFDAAKSAPQVHEWDERFSTSAVERDLITTGTSRAQRKQVIDQHAAAFILQGWIDARVAAVAREEAPD